MTELQWQTPQEDYKAFKIHIPLILPFPYNWTCDLCVSRGFILVYKKISYYFSIKLLVIASTKSELCCFEDTGENSIIRQILLFGGYFTLAGNNKGESLQQKHVLHLVSDALNKRNIMIFLEAKIVTEMFDKIESDHNCGKPSTKYYFIN